jgi:hypothetical protein
VRISSTFVYEGPFPWRCCNCPAPVMPGQDAFRVEVAGQVRMSHVWEGHVWIDDLIAHQEGLEPPAY